MMSLKNLSPHSSSHGRITATLEASHHRWLRQILHIWWKDTISNDNIKERSQQRKLKDGLGRHAWTMTALVWVMSTDVLTRAAVLRFPPGGKRKIGPLRTDTAVKQDISRGGFSWNDLPTLTADRNQWKNWPSASQRGKDLSLTASWTAGVNYCTATACVECCCKSDDRS